ncbi:MAG: T9SS type A sorting domain-containing protein [Flavobacteriaceae bacterium]
MLRKLLLLLLIGFAFTEVNAQLPTALTGSYSNCGPISVDFDALFDDSPTNSIPTLVNGKYSYVRAPSSGDNSVGIIFNGTDWVMYYNSNTGSPVYLQTIHNPADNGIDEAHLFPPDTGWVSNGDPCSLTATMELTVGAVLPVSREEFSNIKIYPNPSTGFINISNLKENSRVVISNITGQIVKDVVVGMNDNRIDIQDLPQGFYFVELEGKKTIKLLKR